MTGIGRDRHPRILFFIFCTGQTNSPCDGTTMTKTKTYPSQKCYKVTGFRIHIEFGISFVVTGDNDDDHFYKIRYFSLAKKYDELRILKSLMNLLFFTIRILASFLLYGIVRLAHFFMNRFHLTVFTKIQ